MLNENIKIAIVGGTGFDSIEGFNSKPSEIITPYDKVYDPVDCESVSPPVDVEEGTIEGAEGVEVLLIKRHGAGHTVPASQVNHRANAYAAFQWGADFAVGITAVGSLDPRINVGDFVVLNRMFRQDPPSSELDFYGRHATVHMDMKEPFSTNISRFIYRACNHVLSVEFGKPSSDTPNFDCYKHLNSTSGAKVTLYPTGGIALINKNNSFSTPEESKRYREGGLNVVGMTTYEALPFALLGIPYGALALPVDRDNLKGENQVTQATVDENVGLFRDRVGKIIHTIAQFKMNNLLSPNINPDLELTYVKKEAMLRLGNSVIGGRVRESLRERDKPLFDNLEKAIRLAEESRGNQ